jgi:hypothetical protein
MQTPNNRQTMSNSQQNNAVAAVALHPLVSQIDEMIRSFDWRTVHAVHCLTTASPHPLENLKSLARKMLIDVATSEEPITVMSNKFVAFIEPTDGNLMLEYNLARIEGLSSLANTQAQATQPAPQNDEY